MKNTLSILLLVLLTHIGYCQQLVLDTFDSKTKQQIKETEWIKVRGTDRSHLKIKLKRVGDNIKLYCTLNTPKRDGRTEAKEHFEIILSDNSKIEIPIIRLSESDVKVALENKMNGVKYTPKLTDEPDAINSDVLTQQQLTWLQNKSIEEINIHFYGEYSKVPVKKKYADVLKAHVALMQ